MSGMGRKAADALENGVTRQRGHKNRWQARMERLDGAQVAKVTGETHSRRLRRMVESDRGEAEGFALDLGVRIR